MRRFVNYLVRDDLPEELDADQQLFIIPSSSTAASNTDATSHDEEMEDMSIIYDNIYNFQSDNMANNNNNNNNKINESKEKYIYETDEIISSTLKHIQEENKKRQQSQTEIQLRYSVHVLENFVNHPDININPDIIVNALREVAQLMVWADQHDHQLWDIFMECSIMYLFAQCLHMTKTMPLPSSSIIQQAPRFQQSNNNNVVKDELVLEKALEKAVEKAMEKGLERALEKAVAKIDSKYMSSNSNHLTPSYLSQPTMSSPIHLNNNHNNSANGSVAKISQSLSSPTVHTSDSTISPSARTSKIPSSSLRYINDSMVRNEKTQQKNEQLWLKLSDKIQSQILQTLSIMIQSIERKESLLCIFANNHINEIISFEFKFQSEEMLGYLISVIKTISLKLDKDLLQLFFNPLVIDNEFPLYKTIIRYYNYPESMVRIAVRNVTLTLCSLDDQQIIKYICDDKYNYIKNSIHVLKKLCGKISRLFEVLLNDGKETFKFKPDSSSSLYKQIKQSDLTAMLEEIEDICMYFGDLASLSEDTTKPMIEDMLCDNIFVPLFCPLSSYACPESLARLRQWYTFSRNKHIQNGASSTQQEQQLISNQSIENNDIPTALPLYDAVGRTLLLTFLLTISKGNTIGAALFQTLYTPNSQFNNRHVIHALKAMATDRYGTERLTFVSLLALRATIDSVNLDVLEMLNLDLKDNNETGNGHHHMSNGHQKDGDTDDHLEKRRQSTDYNGYYISREGKTSGSGYLDDENRRIELDDRMVMSLQEFDDPVNKGKLPMTSYPPLPPSPLTPTFDRSISSPYGPTSHTNVNHNFNNTRQRGRFATLMASTVVGRTLVNTLTGSTSSDSINDRMNQTSLASIDSILNDGNLNNEADMDKDLSISWVLEEGNGMMNDIINCIIISKLKYREIRSKRIIYSICNILNQIGECCNNWEMVIQFYKQILENLATKLKLFIQNKKTTIVSIEKAFESFLQSIQDIDDDNVKENERLNNLNLVENIIHFLTSYPNDNVNNSMNNKNIGRRKRKGMLINGYYVQNIEREDTDCIIIFILSYEQVVAKYVSSQQNTNSFGFVKLSDLVKANLEDCSLEDSYLDKRDAIENVVIAIDAHGK